MGKMYRLWYIAVKTGVRDTGETLGQGMVGGALDCKLLKYCANSTSNNHFNKCKGWENLAITGHFFREYMILILKRIFGFSSFVPLAHIHQRSFEGMCQ